LPDSRFIAGFVPDTTIFDVPVSWPVVSSVLGNSYFFVIVVTLLSLLLVCVYCIVKYAPLMLNDIRNVTNQELPDTGIMCWMALLFTLPLFFDVGPAMLVAWWFLVFWCYMLGPERRIVYVFIFLVMISGWITHVGAGFVIYPENHLNLQIFSVQHHLSTEGDIHALHDWVRQNPDDAEPMNALAIQAIERSDWHEAVRLLNRCIDLEPGNPRFYNHLAVAFVGEDRPKDALKYLQAAARLQADNMIYHYNMSRVYQSTYNFYEGEKEIALASGIDSKLVRYLLDTENSLGKTRYILEKTPLSRYLARQMRPSKTLSDTSDALWYSMFGLVQRKASVFLGVGLLIAIALMNSIPRDKFSKQCSRCGKVYFSGTYTKTGNPMCLQCAWLDSKAKRQENAVVHHKAAEIRRFKALSVLRLPRMETALPGLGCFLVNRTGMALTRLVVLSACLTAIVTGGDFIVSFMPVHLRMVAAVRICGIIFLAILILRAYRVPPLRYGG
jgi:tetratricopeptide (TPR) repeat protein